MGGVVGVESAHRFGSLVRRGSASRARTRCPLVPARQSVRRLPHVNMSWSDERTIRFIEEYRKHPVLWDPSNKVGNAIHRRAEAWDSIAEVFGHEYNPAELKKKMASLMASYRRQRRQAKDEEDDESWPANPAWFAYNSFSFMHDIYQPRKLNNTDDELIECQLGSDVKEELVSDSSQASLDNGASRTNETATPETPHQPTPGKRARVSGEDSYEPPSRDPTEAPPRMPPLRFPDYQQVNGASSQLQSSFAECDIYGKLIATKLKRLDEQTRDLAMHKIDNLLFELKSQGNFY